ncbi:MAG: glycoside hydrolase family 95 protein [Candidatus Omnitrophica bacterium]|nr:glycoside hydrolase family 95 protein [Candidatus Omnitrophota bacterium]
MNNNKPEPAHIGCHRASPSSMLLAAMLIAGAVHASLIPGTRFEVDWPGLVSGQDLILTTPPQSAVHGLLLGNGDIGVSVYGAPEIIILQVGKNDLWDYRDPVQDLKKTLKPWTYRELLERYTGDCKSNRVEAVSKAFMDEHVKPYHMPKPAGQIRVRAPSLRTAAYQQRLSLWNAEVITRLGRPAAMTLRTFVSYPRNLIVLQCESSGTQTFDLELARHKDSTGTIPQGPEFGADGRDLWLRYHFPPSEPYPNGFDYAMYGRVLGGTVQAESLEGKSVAHVTADAPVTLLVAVETTRDAADPWARAKAEAESADHAGLARLRNEHQEYWHSFWQRSFVQIPNRYVNRHWFISYYHLACCARAGRIMPGLDGNWSWEDNPMWFAAYYWNTCTENLFYGAYSGNHLEQAIPYNETVFDLLPAAQYEAREIYGMRGARIPHTTYPHTRTGSPVPFLPFDLQLCETPWAAQELWWYYLYSQDKHFLRIQGYPVLRECATFFEDYLHRAPDGKFDHYPTFSPEHWSIENHFTHNRNCIVDLSLVKYLMRACVAASEALDCDAERRPLWRDIADNLRGYPTAETPEGKVFVDVENAPYPYITYNLPCPAMAIFPGDDIGLQSPEPIQAIARRTIKALYDFPPTQGYIMLPMARVRLGQDVLDEMETRTRQRCFLNQAVYTDCFRWIWAENFGAPIVVNESLLQSYTGQLRLAPVKLQGTARFGQLRAVGAFLVSGEVKAGSRVSYAAITSEAGRPCSIIKPWAGEVRLRRFPSMAPVEFTENNGLLTFGTEKDTTYILDRTAAPWEKLPVVNVSAQPATPLVPEWFRIRVPGVWPSGWNLIGTGSGKFVPTAEGAVMRSHGPKNSTSAWQLPIPPTDTSKFTRLETTMHGVGKGKVRIETVGANGGEVVAAQEWSPWPTNETTLSLNLPAGRTLVAVSVYTVTNDGQPVENHLQSIRFRTPDGQALNLDLTHISP